jgi:hypothetical protein
MNGFAIRYFLVLLILGHLPILCFAQQGARWGALPELNASTSFNSLWGANFKVQSRQLFLDRTAGIPEALEYEYVLTDLAVAGVFRIDPANSLALGYLVRVEKEQLIHRTIQQFSHVRKYSGWRLGHRFSADQTYSSDDPTEYRFRYRIGADLPLNGQEVDPLEFYLKITNEYLHAVAGSAYDLEIRLGPVLGFVFTDTNKLELGLDYRIDSFLDGGYRSSFWTALRWYVKL